MRSHDRCWFNTRAWMWSRMGWRLECVDSRHGIMQRQHRPGHALRFLPLTFSILLHLRTDTLHFLSMAPSTWTWMFGHILNGMAHVPTFFDPWLKPSLDTSNHDILSKNPYQPTRQRPSMPKERSSFAVAIIAFTARCDMS